MIMLIYRYKSGLACSCIYPEIPLRVGTVGSQYYHRLDCPSVNNSWLQHGIEKRIDFYTWDKIEASGRIADDAVCKAGSRENPSGL